MDSNTGSDGENDAQNLINSLSNEIKSKDKLEPEIDEFLREARDNERCQDRIIKGLSNIIVSNPELRQAVINILPEVIGKLEIEELYQSINTELIASLAYFEWDSTIEVLEDPSDYGQKHTGITLSESLIRSSNHDHREWLIAAAVRTITEAASEENPQVDVTARIDDVVERKSDREEFFRRLNQITGNSKVRKYLRDNILPYLLEENPEKCSKEFHLLIKNIAYHHWPSTLKTVGSTSTYNPRIGLVKAVIETIGNHGEWDQTEVEDRMHAIWKNKSDRKVFLRELTSAIESNSAIGNYLLSEFPNHLFIWIKSSHSVEGKEVLSAIAQTNHNFARKWLLNFSSPIAWGTDYIDFPQRRFESLSLQTLARIIKVRPDIIKHDRPDLLTNTDPNSSKDPLAAYIISNIDPDISPREREAALSGLAVILNCLPRKNQDARDLQEKIITIIKIGSTDRQQAIHTLVELIKTYPEYVSIDVEDFLLTKLSTSSLPLEKEAAARALSILNEFGNPNNAKEIQKQLIRLLGSPERLGNYHNTIKISLSLNYSSSAIRTITSDIQNNQRGSGTLMRGLVRSLEITGENKSEKIELFVSEQLEGENSRVRQSAIEALLELFIKDSDWLVDRERIENCISSVPKNEILSPKEHLAVVPIQEPERLAWGLIADSDMNTDIPHDKTEETLECVIERGYEHKIPTIVDGLLRVEKDVLVQLLSVVDKHPHLFVNGGKPDTAYINLLEVRFELTENLQNRLPLITHIVARLIQTSPSAQADILTKVEENVHLPDRTEDPNGEVYERCRDSRIHNGIRKIVYYDYDYKGETDELVDPLQQLRAHLTGPAKQACSEFLDLVQPLKEDEAQKRSCIEALTDLTGTGDVSPEEVKNEIESLHHIELNDIYKLSELYMSKVTSIQIYTPRKLIIKQREIYTPQTDLTKISYLGENLENSINEATKGVNMRDVEFINAIEFKKESNKLLNRTGGIRIKRYGNIMTGPLQILAEAVLWCDLETCPDDSQSSKTQRINYQKIYNKFKRVDQDGFKRAVDWTIAHAVRAGINQSQIESLIDGIARISSVDNDLEHVVNGVWTCTDSPNEVPLSPTWKIAINEDIADLRTEYTLNVEVNSGNVPSHQKGFHLIAYAAQQAMNDENIDYTTQQNRWACILDYLINDPASGSSVEAVSEVIQATADDEIQIKFENNRDSFS